MTEVPTENVQDYPRPPDLQPVPQVLTVRFGGQVVAQTRTGLRVLETHHPPTYYIPPEDVAPGVLVPAKGGSFCEWKGRAVYFDLTAGGETAKRAVWSYPDPTPRFKALAGYLAFYPAALQSAHVGDTAVIPQPGDFYGGWVTPNLQGLIKGAPGTEGW